MSRKSLVLLSGLIFLSIGCAHKAKPSDYRTIGKITNLDPELNDLIAPDARIEILAEGFEWAEGPLWLEGEQCVVFSDIPRNQIVKWKESEGKSVYLEKSGYDGQIPRPNHTGDTDEPGSNGLLLNRNGELVLCQHGNRQVAVMQAPLHSPKAAYKPLVTNYEGKRLNSPNDAAYHPDGSLYFTDPPYGLAQRMEDPAKELPYQGVYRLSRDGKLTLLTDKLTRPNGIAFSPDYKTLYVAVSDPEKAIWMAYDVRQDGGLGNGRVFYDATHMVSKSKGLPDGLKVNDDGYLFATGPGGVLIFNSQGKHLGTIETTQATSNCAFGKDKKTLYITADMYLLRVHLK